jgi:hypothetical protein
MSADHDKFLVDYFRRDVHVVTEWKDGCVWKTKKLGEVAAMSKNPPLRQGVGALLVSHTQRRK